MNNSIKRIQIIDRNLLDEENYLQSLIEQACHLNVLDENEIERIQLDCLELLTSKIKKYNGLDSSSIRVEIAQNIMKSNLYTIGLWLKTYSCPDEAIKVLKELKISEIYDGGRKRIASMMRTLKTFHSIVLKNLLDTNNYTYNATVIDGIKGFFKIYEPEYEAHDIRITADYPLFNSIKNFVGIEFIHHYLNSIHYENLFCRNFSSEAIHHLLSGYDRNYKDLVVNIYEIVLSTAIGCMIAKADVENLELTEESIEYLNKVLSGKSRYEIESIVWDAFEEIKQWFQIKDTMVIEYLKRSLSGISINIHNALNLHIIDKIFIIRKNTEWDTKVYFSFGEKMDNDRYRRIVDEIIQCRYLGDKIAIIKEKIKTLADFEDVIHDGEFDENEIMVILKMINPTEIAAFCRKYSFGDELELDEIKLIGFREVEQGFCRCLSQFISSLPSEQQILIKRTMESLE
jgi:hypothetical protein